jgi:hypothetical protein
MCKIVTYFKQTGATKMPKRWYVYDEYDCFNVFDTVFEAGVLAEELAKEFNGIHIKYQTNEEFDEYCKGAEHVNK